jgi:4-amino-4-deoxy-L-arabinose transferase-like glycosyltransferase
MTVAEREQVEERVPRRRPWALRLLAQVPRELAILWVVVAVFGVTWALVTPALQAPDENSHFSYSQTLAELHRLPGTAGQSVSGEEVNASAVTNADPVAFFVYAKPELSRGVYEQWKHGPHGSRTDGGGSNPAATYPPAYYLYETIPYLLARSGTIFDRLYLMRIFSVAWLLVTTTMAWLLAGEVFGTRARRRQLLTAATVGLWPMLSFVSASVNPDAMLYATWAAALWLGARLIRRGLTLRGALALGAVVGLAMVTKATTLALIPAAVIAIAIAFVRAPPARWQRHAMAVGASLLAFAVPVATWAAVVRADSRPAYAQTSLLSPSGDNSASSGQSRGHSSGRSKGADFRGFASYMWQYYLPRLPFMKRNTLFFPVISQYPAYNVWIGTGWAAFGWVTIFFSSWVYVIFGAITLLLVGAAAVTGVRRMRQDRREALRRSWPLGLFFASAFFPLWLGIHWSEWTTREPFTQGRYLFPVAALAGLVVAQATTVLPRRLRGIATGALLGGLLALEVGCLLLVTTRFYA